MRQALEGMHGILPIGLEAEGAGEEILARVDVEHCKSRRRGERMAGIGIAVRQLHRDLRAGHEGDEGA